MTTIFLNETSDGAAGLEDEEDFADVAATVFLG